MTRAELNETYRQIENCRRKLLGYSFTSTEARNECWQAESDLYELEEMLLGEPSNDDDPPPMGA